VDIRLRPLRPDEFDAFLQAAEMTKRL